MGRIERGAETTAPPSGSASYDVDTSPPKHHRMWRMEHRDPSLRSGRHHFFWSTHCGKPKNSVIPSEARDLCKAYYRLITGNRFMLFKALPNGNYH